MKTVKITSGKYRGQSILTPDSVSTHPMGSREKLALFNMVSDLLPGARVLDAFAGSGALGIEAISRGSTDVVFIEKDKKTCEVISKNLKKVGLRAEVFRGDVNSFVTNKQFDLILADPPYDRFEIDSVQYISSFVKSGGFLVLSHSGDAPDLGGFDLIKTKQYASAHLSVYAKR